MLAESNLASVESINLGLQNAGEHVYCESAKLTERQVDAAVQALIQTGELMIQRRVRVIFSSKSLIPGHRSLTTKAFSMRCNQLLLSALFLTVSAHAQTNCQQIGNQTYCHDSDGNNWNSQRIGAQTYSHDNNGNSWNSQRIGDQTYSHDNVGNSWWSQRIGDQTYSHDDNGNSWNSQRIGGQTFINDSNGNSASCQRIGDQVFCH